jgi:serine/threonine-protein kinase
VGGEPFVKVLDFGIAKHPPGALEDLTDAQRFMGTARYTSPEQLVSARDVDYRTDLWALAVVAYEALTGQLPFQGETIGAQTLKVHAGGFAVPTTLRPELPSAVDAWAARALRQDAAGRFVSAPELAEALEQALRQTRGEEQAARPARVEAEISKAPAAPAAPSVQERYATMVSGSAPPHSRSTQEISIGARRIRIMQGNLVQAGADAGVEALVNATDERLSGSNGVDLAIHSAAGPMLREMTGRLGGCPVGRAVLTGAGQIPPPVRFVLHAVGPAFERERKAECDGLLRSVYRECLRLADGNNIRSLAFPTISTGTSGSYGITDAASIALGEVADHLAGPARVVDLVVFVLFSSKHYAAFAEALEATARSRGGMAS